MARINGEFFIHADEVWLDNGENLESLGTNVSTATIASGEITVPGTFRIRFITVDTQGSAATDDLDVINGGVEGDLLFLQAANDARSVVLKNSASLPLGADFTMNITEDKTAMICTSTNVWERTATANNGS